MNFFIKRFLSKILNEIPFLPYDCIQFLKSYCEDESRTYIGITTLKELILRRPGLKDELLDILLQLSSNPSAEIRTKSINEIKKLHEKDDFRKNIEVKLIFNLTSYTPYLLIKD